MNNNEKRELKLPWNTPRITVHGTLADITRAQNKTYGDTDGFLFQGVAIANAS